MGIYVVIFVSAAVWQWGLLLRTLPPLGPSDVHDDSTAPSVRAMHSAGRVAWASPAMNDTRPPLPTQTYGAMHQRAGSEAETLGALPPRQASSPRNPVVTIHMANASANASRIEAELYPKHAPNTVNNFIYLATRGFYNNSAFHRVIPLFVIQGGWSWRLVPYTIRGEFRANGVNNTLLHSKGVLAMARSGRPNSASSQFYIALGHRAPGLDGSYATFGKVTKGLNVANHVARQPRSAGDRPKVKQGIEYISVETFGHSYPLPETIPAGKAVA